MSVADMVRRMAAAGATPEAIAIAVEALEQAQPSKGALRTRRWREKNAAESVTERHETSQNVTEASPCASQNVTSSPTPPLFSSLSVEPLKEERKKESLESGRASANAVPKVDPFDEFKRRYPKREGANPWQPARKKFLAALKAGATADEIFLGVERFAVECAERGIVGTPFVPQAVKWLNQQQWSDYTEPIAAPVEDESLPAWLRKATPEAIQRWRETEAKRANGQGTA